MLMARHVPSLLRLVGVYVIRYTAVLVVDNLPHDPQQIYVTPWKERAAPPVPASVSFRKVASP
jgi:hypothetical protein